MGKRTLKIDLNSKKKLGKVYGDKMSLKGFLNCCHSGSFIDYDGYMSEMIINGYVVSDNPIYPSDALAMEDKLLKLQKEHGKIHVVWYNR